MTTSRLLGRRGDGSAVVRGWVAVYTLGLPAAIGARRRSEVAGDLADETVDAVRRGETADLRRRRLVRWFAGIPDDLTWRFVDAPELARTVAWRGTRRGLGAPVADLAAAARHLGDRHGRGARTRRPGGPERPLDGRDLAGLGTVRVHGGRFARAGRGAAGRPVAPPRPRCGRARLRDRDGGGAVAVGVLVARADRARRALASGERGRPGHGRRSDELPGTRRCRHPPKPGVAVDLPPALPARRAFARVRGHEQRLPAHPPGARPPARGQVRLHVLSGRAELLPVPRADRDRRVPDVVLRAPPRRWRTTTSSRSRPR